MAVVSIIIVMIKCQLGASPLAGIQIVASQTRARPMLHGTKVMPSGPLPSDNMPLGSIMVGTLTVAKIQRMMTLNSIYILLDIIKAKREPKQLQIH